MIGPRLLLAALLFAGDVAVADPDQPGGLGRAVEMPAHRALMAERQGRRLTAFETDGCSGGLSAGWRLVADAFPDFAEAYAAHPPWEACCVTHDRAYHAAGGATSAEESWQARLDADAALRSCVAGTAEGQVAAMTQLHDVTPEQVRAGYRAIAAAMYHAVRLGGGPCSGLPWRWGFGYPDCLPFGARE